tara:strand:- start:194 stop:457 length:264 start_codon:yes stop_codon:yes gene_type:complete
MPTQDERIAAMQRKQRAWKRKIHDECRTAWAKRVKTKLELISFNASMKELDEELEKRSPAALEAMADVADTWAGFRISKITTGTSTD